MLSACERAKCLRPASQQRMTPAAPDVCVEVAEVTFIVESAGNAVMLSRTDLRDQPARLRPRCRVSSLQFVDMLRNPPYDVDPNRQE